MSRTLRSERVVVALSLALSVCLVIHSCFRFVSICSLSALLQSGAKAKIDNSPVLVEFSSSSSEQERPGPLSKSDSRRTSLVTVGPSSFYLSSTETNPFCEEWSHKMKTGEDDDVTLKSAFLRQVIEQQKLKAIQDVNSLRRFITQSEASHHALYRSFLFLKSCGNAAVLLCYARQEALSLKSRDSLLVLDALSSHLVNGGVIS
eukprot:m.25186 g.25186  ORF g.25186 m.25186 type:complete len:204 (+) comp28757_c0_seq2:590-1201(+)